MDGWKAREDARLRRRNFRIEDIVPEKADDDHLFKELVFSAAELLLDHHPGLQSHRNINKWRKELMTHRPHKRPIPITEPSRAHPLKSMLRNSSKIDESMEISNDILDQLGSAGEDSFIRGRTFLLAGDLGFVHI